MKSTYKLIKHIKTISEKYGTTIEFNIMQWYDNKPKYDIRKWEDDKPTKGISLSKEELRNLYCALHNEINRLDNKNSFNKASEDIKPIDYRNFIIYNAYNDCQKKNHDYQDIKVLVPHYSNINNKVEEIILPARYCKTCKQYYISDYQYQIHMRFGRILCKVVSKEDYEKYIQESSFEELSPQSILNIVGYTVNGIDDFTDDYRQNILKYAIAEGVFTKDKAINHISFLIKLNEKKSNMEIALSKWKKDRAYLTNYKEQPLYGIHKIIK